MRYDDDRYLDDEADNDLWDDELDLNSDDSIHAGPEAGRMPHAPEEYYSPYHDEDPIPEKQDNTDSEENDYYSEPESETPRRSTLRSLFGRKPDDEDQEGDDNEEENDDPDEENDYYDSAAAPEPPRRPKAPKLDPEDPDYWIEEEESPLSGIMTGPGKKWKWKLAAVVAFLLLILFGWIWFFRPHTDNAVKYGYITNMERRGALIKTFEGSMIPYKELGDPDPLYFKEVRFSVKGDSLAALMKRMMLGCVPVRVEYEVYHTPLPWKGEERMIVIKADTADPRKILPPEYRHNY
ncbi:MAG: hypothetical protein K2L11_10340 [Muribaculaceae bacterium]|nr:hypothetical protein [Muribaculaceae bacterium]